MDYKQMTDYDYKVYRNGDIYSNKSNKVLKPARDGGGYGSVTLCNEYGRDRLKIHHLVATHFLVEPVSAKTLIIDHIDHNRTNNHADNLRYITIGENHINRDNATNKHGYTGVQFKKAYIKDGKIIRSPAYTAQIQLPNGDKIRKWFYVRDDPSSALNRAIEYRKALESEHYPGIKVV